MMARADLDTFVQLPWRPNVAMVSCNIYVDHEPWPYCARNNLIRMMDRLAAEGQYEINFGWTNALHSADRLVRFRMLAGQIANKYGAIATFMAKPFEDKTGSGAHFHFHLADAETHQNLFPLNGDGRDLKGLGLSAMAVHYIGGLLKHIHAITAIASPNVNCYRRIQSGEFVYSSRSGYTWTPAFASYGDNNRTQLYRCPDNNRIEDRSPSAMVNPYLLMAAQMAAGLDGIKNRIDPGEAIIGENVWNFSCEERRKRGMIQLPQNLMDAVKALEADDVVKAGLGPIAEEYIKLKKAEWSEYMRQVTPWEIDRYLTLL